MNIVNMPPEKGVCDICNGFPSYATFGGPYPQPSGEAAKCTLLFYDRVTGLKAGRCCERALKFADRSISELVHKTGICHPPLP